MLWFLGREGIEKYRGLQGTALSDSKAFPYAGTYVMRSLERYLCFNASGAGLNGRGSHGHNDSLSIDVWANGQSFIVDPGTYVYTGDLKQRHLFRSTAFHSTVRIDGEEQNSTSEATPFVIGDEAHPRVVEWQSGDLEDRVVAEHPGYRRLSSPVVHRRTVVFKRNEGSWLIDDEFYSEGKHEYEVNFHFAPGLEVKAINSSVRASDTRATLSVSLLNLSAAPVLEIQACSLDYGQKMESVTACWHFSGKPCKISWKIEVMLGAQASPPAGLPI